MPQGKTSVVIPVCNQLGYTRLCMDYLLESADAGFELVIIDNGSSDGTKTFFEGLSGRVELVYHRNDTNLGPIEALNQGIEKSAGDVIVTMHNDLVIFEKGWLAKLGALLRENEDIGLVGLAGRKVVDKRGVVDERSLVHHLVNEDLNAPMEGPWQEVAVLDGVFIAGRRSVFEKIEGFDRIYGLMHYYDVDISLKARQSGFRNAVINIEALHVNNGGITRKTQAYKTLVPDDLKLLNANSRIYFKRWHKYFPIEIK